MKKKWFQAAFVLLANTAGFALAQTMGRSRDDSKPEDPDSLALATISSETMPPSSSATTLLGLQLDDSASPLTLVKNSFPIKSGDRKEITAANLLAEYDGEPYEGIHFSFAAMEHGDFMDLRNRTIFECYQIDFEKRGVRLESLSRTSPPQGNVTISYKGIELTEPMRSILVPPGDPRLVQSEPIRLEQGTTTTITEKNIAVIAYGEVQPDGELRIENLPEELCFRSSVSEECLDTLSQADISAEKTSVQHDGRNGPLSRTTVVTASAMQYYSQSSLLRFDYIPRLNITAGTPLPDLPTTGGRIYELNKYFKVTAVDVAEDPTLSFTPKHDGTVFYCGNKPCTSISLSSFRAGELSVELNPPPTTLATIFSCDIQATSGNYSSDIFPASLRATGTPEITIVKLLPPVNGYDNPTRSNSYDLTIDATGRTARACPGCNFDGPDIRCSDEAKATECYEQYKGELPSAGFLNEHSLSFYACTTSNCIVPQTDIEDPHNAFGERLTEADKRTMIRVIHTERAHFVISNSLVSQFSVTDVGKNRHVSLLAPEEDDGSPLCRKTPWGQPNFAVTLVAHSPDFNTTSEPYVFEYYFNKFQLPWECRYVPRDIIIFVLFTVACCCGYDHHEQIGTTVRDLIEKFRKSDDKTPLLEESITSTKPTVKTRLATKLADWLARLREARERHQQQQKSSSPEDEELGQVMGRAIGLGSGSIQ
jgi:hypothetical protein